jgi:hypothetical protein
MMKFAFRWTALCIVLASALSAAANGRSQSRSRLSFPMELDTPPMEME